MGDRYAAPAPQSHELPKAYADRIGRWYQTSVSQEHKKALGQYLTPVEVAEFMARLHSPVCLREVRILDPGAGTGILACALCESLANSPDSPREIYVEAYEVDPDLAQYLNNCLEYAQEWLKDRGITLQFLVSTEDFVMAYGETLIDSPRLFSLTKKTIIPFDVVISNPPYFKIAKSDRRAQAAAAVVHGQPNIYAIFMAISASLLKQGGYLTVITPRSYTAGPYFRLFREKFFANMRPEFIHIFHSRRDAFQHDDVLQENVILSARRVGGWISESRKPAVKVSHSFGIQDLSKSKERWVPLADILDWRNEEKVLRIPVTDRDDVVTDILRSWDGDFHKYGLEISTGPVVPFRATSVISVNGQVPQTHAPLIWMQNVTAMCVKWPVNTREKEQYVILSPIAMPLLIPAKNYVLLRRFSSKEQVRRLTAAPLLMDQLNTPLIGLENHLNYIHRPGGSLSEEEAYGFAVLLNSELLDAYFRIQNGNTQVSATELRAMPLPPLSQVIEIGRIALGFSEMNLELLDDLVINMLEIDYPQARILEAVHGQNW